MLQLLLKWRTITHTMFGGFEHICALGYACHEFKIEIGRLLLIIGSVGLMVFAVALCVDKMTHHLMIICSKLCAKQYRNKLS